MIANISGGKDGLSRRETEILVEFRLPVSASGFVNFFCCFRIRDGDFSWADSDNRAWKDISAFVELK